MVSWSLNRRLSVRSPWAAALLLSVVTLCGTALAPSSLPAQTTVKQGDRHQKLLAQDLAHLKELFKDKLVTLEVSAGKQKNYMGRIVGVREIFSERFLELACPEGFVGGPSRALINCKTIIGIYQE